LRVALPAGMKHAILLELTHATPILIFWHC